ncbi:PsbP-related protein [Methanobacterium alcaliphilum]|uniref:PsbP-related protein n=1 Tax=Methanobacterium alcaliphilum TaxID=392018 RepID=UPI00200AF693|nr:PsbP-related protein [Methanobacterium alcaliphilum]MCK9151472.1 hypothetical protein [Methanobacterium alcaliphilum]
MKKYFLVVLIISLVIFASGCTSSSDEKTNQTKTIAQNNVSFSYPGTWVVANSRANDTIVAVADPGSVNAQTGFAETVVSIQKREVNGTFDKMFQQNYASLFDNSSYQRVSESNLTVGSFEAMDNVYTMYDNGVQKTQRAIWIESGDYVYVILCSALSNQFEDEKQNFDLIIDSFKITG